MTLLRPRIALPCSCSFRSLPAACRGTLAILLYVQSGGGWGQPMSDRAMDLLAPWHSGRGCATATPLLIKAQHLLSAVLRAGRSRGLAVRAQEGQQPQESAASSAADDRESTLEALEASVRARRGVKAAQMEVQRPQTSSMRVGGQTAVVRGRTHQGGCLPWLGQEQGETSIGASSSLCAAGEYGMCRS